MRNQMKLALAALLIGVTSAPAFAGGPTVGYRSRGGYAEEQKCYRREYREEYIPGTSKNPGYVKRYNKKYKIIIMNIKLIIRFNNKNYIKINV